jgi:hypothetical protein
MVIASTKLVSSLRTFLDVGCKMYGYDSVSEQNFFFVIWVFVFFLFFFMFELEFKFE